MTSQLFDAVVVGNVGIDTQVYLPGYEIDFRVEANFTENLDCVGQAGGYSSRGFAQLGKRCAFIGYAGDDFQGQHIRDELSGDGVDLTGLFIDPAGTSRSINIMYPDGRRKNFYDGKSHMTLEPDLEQCAAILRHTTLAHFHLPHWARRLLPLAREAGVLIACDLQDMPSVYDEYRRDFIEQADILFFSSVNLDDPVAAVQHILHMRSGRIVVVGMGKKGCLLGTDQGIRSYGAVDLPLPIVDTNGAGDGLAVGFLASYVLEGRSLEESIRRGQIVARYTCAQRSSSSSLISSEALEAFSTA